MKKILLPVILSIVATPAIAVPRVQAQTARDRYDYTFYVGASYVYSMLSGDSLYTESEFAGNSGVRISNQGTSNFDVSMGVSVINNLRLELSYVSSGGKNLSIYEPLSNETYVGKFESDILFANIYLDGLFREYYQSFEDQILVPYIGIGAGYAWNKLDGVGGVTVNSGLSDDQSFAFNAMAGFGVSLNKYMMLDLGYRLVMMDKVDITIDTTDPIGVGTVTIKDFRPMFHQVRAGMRLMF